MFCVNANYIDDYIASRPRNAVQLQQNTDKLLQYSQCDTCDTIQGTYIMMYYNDL